MLDVKVPAASITGGRSSASVKHRALAFNPAGDSSAAKSHRNHRSGTSTSPRRTCADWPRSQVATADLVLVLAFTGFRWGEAIALTVADVESLKCRISVHRNAVQTLMR